MRRKGEGPWHLGRGLKSQRWDLDSKEHAHWEGGYLWGTFPGAWQAVQTPGSLHDLESQGVLKMTGVDFPGQASSGI